MLVYHLLTKYLYRYTNYLFNNVYFHIMLNCAVHLPDMVTSTIPTDNLPTLA